MMAAKKKKENKYQGAVRASTTTVAVGLGDRTTMVLAISPLTIGTHVSMALADSRVYALCVYTENMILI